MLLGIFRQVPTGANPQVDIGYVLFYERLQHTATSIPSNLGSDDTNRGTIYSYLMPSINDSADQDSLGTDHLSSD